MIKDICYCDGQKPFDKCKACKRFIANRTPDDMVWKVEPCLYMEIENSWLTVN